METNFKNNKIKIWIKWMNFGKKLGCHQMPERSFFINGYQFPVCARCSGVILSSYGAFLIFFFYKISFKMSFILCMIMFIDWFIQRIGIKESTNFRRFITGLLGGYGFTTIQIYICLYLIKIIMYLIC